MHIIIIIIIIIITTTIKTSPASRIPLTLPQTPEKKNRVRCLIASKPTILNTSLSDDGNTSNLRIAEWQMSGL